MECMMSCNNLKANMYNNPLSQDSQVTEMHFTDGSADLHM